MLVRRRVASVVGTRPNLMKIAPVLAELERRTDEFESVLIHTGQHYDEEMSPDLLRGARHPRARHRLDVGSGTHAQQTARVMERLEPVLTRAPDVVLVPGDVNSTLAAALVAVEARHPRRPRRGGPAQLRPHDARGDQPHRHRPALRSPVHPLVRRRATICSREGCAASAIHYVGNTMIDTLVRMRPRIDADQRRRARTACPRRTTCS